MANADIDAFDAGLVGCGFRFTMELEKGPLVWKLQ